MLFSNLKDLSKDEYNSLIDKSKLEIENVLPRVKTIIEDVKNRGDEALRHFTKQFDGVEIEDFKVTKEEFDGARKEVDSGIKDALKEAKKNIEEFHKKQLQKDFFYERNGAKLGQIIRHISKVGCYIPGGRASYPSTVLMTTLPAKVAGVKNIICVTPPNKEGKANECVLVACEIAGIKEVYKIGGAQGIAAMAYGTESIPKVDKIVGPGNIYVNAAKKLLYGEVAIDMIAGPSEVLIIADSSAKAGFIAWDMMAQAEHDINARSILITTSRELAEEVKERIDGIEMQRGETKESLEKNGAILIADGVEEAIEFANNYAPEHLQIMTKEPDEVLKHIKNAGSIFLGPYTPVALGDYASGTNHVLPTQGTAKVSSGLSVFDFVKFISVQEFDKDALKKIEETITTIAEAEGLYGHAESVRKRLGK